MQWQAKRKSRRKKKKACSGCSWSLSALYARDALEIPELNQKRSGDPNPQYFWRTAKGAGGKGPRQETSKSVKNNFDNFRAGAKKSQKSSKSVKIIFDTLRRFSRGTNFQAKFLGGSHIFPKVLPYKWGACCRRNGRRTAVQMGGVLQGVPFFEA